MRRNNSVLTVPKITRLALLIALCVVGRMAFQWLPNVQPITVVLMLITIHSSWLDGCLVATGSILVSNIFLGMGPWTIAQILSYMFVISFVASGKYFIEKGKFKKKGRMLAYTLISFLAGILYGFVISVITAFMLGIAHFWVYYLQGISFDVLHALGNVGFYLILAPIMGPLFAKMQQRLKK